MARIGHSCLRICGFPQIWNFLDPSVTEEPFFSDNDPIKMKDLQLPKFTSLND